MNIGVFSAVIILSSGRCCDGSNILSFGNDFYFDFKLGSCVFCWTECL